VGMLAMATGAMEAVMAVTAVTAVTIDHVTTATVGIRSVGAIGAGDEAVHRALSRLARVCCETWRTTGVEGLSINTHRAWIGAVTTIDGNSCISLGRGSDASKSIRT